MSNSYWFNTSSGRIEFQLTADQAHTGSHTGKCDDDIEALLKEPSIKSQLEKIEPDLIASELKEYGAWDVEELKDHDQNLARLLWLACGDIVETIFEEESEHA